MSGMDYPSCGWCKFFTRASPAESKPAACKMHHVVLPTSSQKHLLCINWSFNVALRQDGTSQELTLESPSMNVFRNWLTPGALFEYDDPDILVQRKREFEIRVVAKFSDLLKP